MTNDSGVPRRILGVALNWTSTSAWSSAAIRGYGRAEVKRHGEILRCRWRRVPRTRDHPLAPVDGPGRIEADQRRGLECRRRCDGRPSAASRADRDQGHRRHARSGSGRASDHRRPQAGHPRVCSTRSSTEQIWRAGDRSKQVALHYVHRPEGLQTPASARRWRTGGALRVPHDRRVPASDPAGVKWLAPTRVGHRPARMYQANHV